MPGSNKERITVRLHVTRLSGRGGIDIRERGTAGKLAFDLNRLPIGWWQNNLLSGAAQRGLAYTTTRRHTHTHTCMLSLNKQNINSYTDLKLGFLTYFVHIYHNGWLATVCRAKTARVNGDDRREKREREEERNTRVAIFIFRFNLAGFRPNKNLHFLFIQRNVSSVGSTKNLGDGVLRWWRPMISYTHKQFLFKSISTSSNKSKEFYYIRLIAVCMCVCVWWVGGWGQILFPDRFVNPAKAKLMGQRKPYLSCLSLAIEMKISRPSNINNLIFVYGLVCVCVCLVLLHTRWNRKRWNESSGSGVEMGETGTTQN